MSQPSLNQVSPSQKIAFDLAINGHNVFITGAPGSGKSFTVEKIYQDMIQNRRNVAVTSSTSASANVYKIAPAKTLHSFMRLGMAEGSLNDLINNLKQKKQFLMQLLSLQTLFIDEITMLDPAYFEKINYVLQALRQSRSAFGGIQIIAIGDPTQLNFEESATKIKKGQNFIHRGSYSIYDTQTWAQCKFETALLAENHRAKDDPRFFQVLENISIGRFSDEDWEYLSQACHNDLKDPIRVVCTHREAEDINISHIKKYNLDVKHFPALNYKPNLPIPAAEYVLLGEGVPVVMVGTNYVRHGIPSGTFGRVLQVYKSNVMVECFAIVQFGDKTIKIQYNCWQVGNEKVYAMPVILAYAVTIHRLQGLHPPSHAHD